MVKPASWISCSRGMLLAIFLIVSAASCLADSYSDQGTVFITGTITAIENQQNCDKYDCHIGSTWSLAMTFLAPDWDAPGSHYTISTVFLNCVGGPPCFVGYQASSDFGWGPYGYDVLYVDIEDGKVVDARVGSGGYFIEWGEADEWFYVNAFSGTTTGYAIPTPEPSTLLLLASGAVLSRVRRMRLFPRMTWSGVCNKKLS